MPGTAVVAVDLGVPAPPLLLAALAAGGMTVQVLTADGLMSAHGGVRVHDDLADTALPVEGRAEVLLAAAALPVRRVREIRRRLGGTLPVLVFTERDFAALGRHVRRGADYLVPPFRPDLVAARIRSAVERGEREQNRLRQEARDRLLAYERELEIGRQIQAGFLPDRLPVPDGWEIEVDFRPARQVAGDFYDVFELVDSRRLALIVADVCDKGVGSALFMALIRTLVRHTAENSGLLAGAAVRAIPGPRRAVGGRYGRGGPVVGATPLLTAITATNRYLTTTHLKQGYFATLFFGVLDPATGALVYANCGHNPPLVLAAAGGARAQLGPTGPAVGVVPNGEFGLGYERLEPGESLFAFTDGVPEARAGHGEFFGDDRLLDLAGPPVLHARDLVGRTLAAIDGHVAGAEQFDDITMLAVRRNATAVQTGACSEMRA